MAYRWLIADEIIEEADAIIAADGTTACLSDGSEFDHRTHVYTGLVPRNIREWEHPRLPHEQSCAGQNPSADLQSHPYR